MREWPQNSWIQLEAAEYSTVPRKTETECTKSIRSWPRLICQTINTATDCRQTPRYYTCLCTVTRNKSRITMGVVDCRDNVVRRSIKSTAPCLQPADQPKVAPRSNNWRLRLSYRSRLSGNLCHPYTSSVLAQFACSPSQKVRLSTSNVNHYASAKPSKKFFYYH